MGIGVTEIRVTGIGVIEIGVMEIGVILGLYGCSFGDIENRMVQSYSAYKMEIVKETILKSLIFLVKDI